MIPHANVIAPASCPIKDFTADGKPAGRCWYYVGVGRKRVCKVHGDVTKEVDNYLKTGRLTSAKERL